MEVLIQHAWPGNIRELRNVVERAATMCGDAITADYMSVELGMKASPMSGGERRILPPTPQEESGRHAVVTAPIEDQTGTSVPLREAKEQLVSDFERQYIERLLEKHDQNISAAAREAQVDRRHFYRLLKKYGLMK